MNRLNAIIGLSLLDFLQRIRSRRFLLTIGIVAIVSISFIPQSNQALFQTMSFDGHRGIYNSAWIGVLIALLTSFSFVFFGFYIIKGGITGDFMGGNREILLTTPGAKIEYIASKIMSNIYWLFSIALSVVVIGIVMQFVRGEDPHLEFSFYLEPFLLITLPVIFFVSSLAILFDTIPLLANTIGNITYFFISMAIIIGGTAIPRLDVIGLSMVFAQIIPAIKFAYPDYGGGWTFIGNRGFRAAEPIVWEGLSWTAEMLAIRFTWIVMACGLFLLAVWTFAHFSTQERTVGSRTLRREEDLPPRSQANLVFSSIQYRRDPQTLQRNLALLVFAEFKFSLMRMSRGYYAVLGILVFVSAVGDPAQMYGSLLPLIWLMPIGIWSQQGVKTSMGESNHILGATVNAIPWSFIAEYLAGFLIAIFSASPLLVRLAISGLWVNVFYILIGSVFITSLAGFLGFWTKGTKTFEVVYLFLWYLGPLNKTGLLDFTGSVPEIVLSKFLLSYLLASLIMVLSVLVSRKSV